MPDESLDDLDPMLAGTLDLSNPEVLRAYLYHPTTQALAEDRGRQFRELPVAQQRATLDAALRARRVDHRHLAAQLQALHARDDAGRAELQRILEVCETIIEAMTLRLHELDEA